MLITKGLKLGLLGVALVSLGGCATRWIDYTVISTKNVQVSKVKGERVRGKDCSPWSIFDANVKEAIDRAIESAGGDYDALVDGVIYARNLPFYHCIEVEGTPVNTKAKTSLRLDEKNLMLHSSLSTVSDSAKN